MKISLFCLSLLFTCFSFAQLSGDIVTDSRKVSNEMNYEMKSKSPGILVFDIAVDVKGNVTSCQLNKMESTLNSQRMSMMARNLIVRVLKFEVCNGCPTFHQGKVTITCVTEEAAPTN